MARPLDPRTMEALTAAVGEIERCSCAEVVVEIRARSGSYAHADARFASLLAFAALLVLLFSPWHFAAGWVAIDVAIVWILGALGARRSDGLRRLFTTAGERSTRVRTAASSVFFERGIANTSAESGVLLYLSLLERRIELLADRGVLEAVPTLAWNQLAEKARASHASTATLLETLQALAPLLSRHLPSREGDQDELCNVPHFISD